jgi:hypothetical protein
MARKLAQADAKIEQDKKKMMLAQHDFKSSQMIQFQGGYVIYFTMLQTMVQKYSASGKEKERHKIICKQFETMHSFEDAQADLKEYNQIVKLDVIDLTSGDNGDVDATPDVAKKDSSAVTLFSGNNTEGRGKKSSESKKPSAENNMEYEKIESATKNQSTGNDVVNLSATDKVLNNKTDAANNKGATKKALKKKRAAAKQ